MEQEPDEDLMVRYAHGDVTAFEVLYERHKGPLFRFVTRQLNDRRVAEEVFQDIWTNVIRSRERYEVRAKFTTWLYRLAHNRVIDVYRASGRQAEVLLHDLEPHGEAGPAEPADQGAPEAGRALDARRAVERLYGALAQLPANQLEAFLLQEEGDLSLEEIAAVTGVGRETVKSRLRYATAKLRAAVQWTGPDAQ